MFDIVTIETAKKLKKVGVQQNANLYFYRPFLIIDRDTYISICKKNNEEEDIKKLVNIKENIWCIETKNFKTTPITITNLPEHYAEVIAAFNLSELVRLYGEDIKIPHGCKNYTEYVALKLIENLSEVNKIFGL